MATTALSVLERRISEQIDDFLEVAVTTAIAANNSIISTSLTSYDYGRDDYFIDWWVYITDKANAGVLRQVSDYATSTGTLTIRGAALASDGANLATIRVHRFNRDKLVNSLNDTIREIFPLLHKRLQVDELVTGNLLPNSHFRDWTASTAPDKYAMQDANITAVAETGAGNYRGGAKSMKATTGAGGAGKYVYITSDSYPKLLDIMGKSVSLYCWANPEAANDPSIEIYTKQADGTAQTLTSTTTAPAGEFTLLKLENQNINDNLVEVQIRFKIATASKYVYFDNARLIGVNTREFLLPSDFVTGKLASVKLQTSVSADWACDDLNPLYDETIHGWQILNNGTDQFLRLPVWVQSSRLLRLEGYAPLSTVSAYTDTIEIGGEQVNLFIAYAKYKFWQSVEAPMSASDIGRYETQSAKAYAEYIRLSQRLSSPMPGHSLNIKGVY